MSSNATSGVETPSCKRKREIRDAGAANAGEAIPGLLNDIVITHVLRSEHFDDPADLARLPAVSRAMRDAAAATGLRFEELDEDDALNLGCLSALQRRQRRGLLSRRELLCQAAARSGQLEELKALRVNGCPWDKETCTDAACTGHLEVLQWVRANGCPWNEDTCSEAAEGGYLEVLQWARANGCPWDIRTCHKAAEGGHLKVLLWARKNGCPCDENELRIAALNGHEAIVWALIELGADVNEADDDGTTPLFIATKNGLEAMVRALIEAGSDVNKATHTGWTPLYIAAQTGHEAIVQILRDTGAM
jgi:hypothetical protein